MIPLDCCPIVALWSQLDIGNCRKSPEGFYARRGHKIGHSRNGKRDKFLYSSLIAGEDVRISVEKSRVSRPRAAFDRARVVELRAAGRSWRETVAALGVSVRTARRVYAQGVAKLSSPETGAVARKKKNELRVLDLVWRKHLNLPHFVFGGRHGHAGGVLSIRWINSALHAIIIP
jgi:hypothetical protein